MSFLIGTTVHSKSPADMLFTAVWHLACVFSGLNKNAVRKLLYNHLTPTANPFCRWLLGILFYWATSVSLENTDYPIFVFPTPVALLPVWELPTPSALMQHPLQCPRGPESECLWLMLPISRFAPWVGRTLPHAGKIPCFFPLGCTEIISKYSSHRAAH